MNAEPHLRWGLPRAAWIAFGLILLGLLVAVLRTLIQPTLERPLYHLSGALGLLGLFGPGLRRELGLLRDQDEFQLAVAQRAGWRAFLAGGLTLLLLAHFMPWPAPPAWGRELPKLPINTALLALLALFELPSFTGVLIDLRFSAGLVLALLIARRYPQVGGLFLLLLAVLTLAALRDAQEATRLSFGALLITPPLITGAALLREGKD